MKIVKFGFSLFGINTYLVYDPSTLKCATLPFKIIKNKGATPMSRAFCFLRPNESS